MALSREVYRRLEDIVGQANISEDPAVLESYRYPLSVNSIHIGPFYNVFTPRGEAVLLPGSTGDVQAIVKVCNKYRIKVKASTTFWSAMGYPSHENTIQLDMKRMDRILDIDEKNMFAVVEPRVTAGQLQAETMRLGLTTHISGAGAVTSPLAGGTSYNGAGPASLFMNSYSMNLLAVEWVRPDGEILRAGSLGADLGWFCGEGPGPSLKGIMRGRRGAMGSMGVYTRAAVKLYPWPGPAEFSVEGKAPAYRTTLPDNFRAYTLAFPTWQAYADTAYKIWDTGLGYICHRQFNLFGRDLKVAMLKIVTDHTRTLDDLEAILEDPQVQKLTKERQRDFEIVLVGMTRRDIEWQDKALDDILAETGGWKVAAMSEPDMQKWVLLYFLRMGRKNINNIYGGTHDSGLGLFGPPDFGTQHIDEMIKFRLEWEKKGAIVNSGGDNALGPIGGPGGGGTAFDNFVFWDPHDKESVEGAFEFYEAETKYMAEHRFGPSFERTNALYRGPDGKAVPQEVRNRAYAASPAAIALRYQGKLKKLLDPNDLGDSYYPWIEEEEGG